MGIRNRWYPTRNPNRNLPSTYWVENSFIRKTQTRMDLIESDPNIRSPGPNCTPHKKVYSKRNKSIKHDSSSKIGSGRTILPSVTFMYLFETHAFSVSSEKCILNRNFFFFTKLF